MTFFWMGQSVFKDEALVRMDCARFMGAIGFYTLL